MKVVKPQPLGGVVSTEPRTWEEFIGAKPAPPPKKRKSEVTDSRGRTIDEQGYTSPGQREAYERARRAGR